MKNWHTTTTEEALRHTKSQAERLPSGILKKTSESGNNSRRMGMDGNVYPDGDGGDDSFSSDEADVGGPRFAALSGGGLASGSSKTTIRCIEEGLDDSSASM